MVDLMLFGITATRFMFLLLFLLNLVVSIFFLELPHVLVRVLHVVVAHVLEDFFQVANGLVRYLDEIFDVVVLVLLERMEQHVHHRILVISGLLALSLLSVSIFDLKEEDEIK